MVRDIRKNLISSPFMEASEPLPKSEKQLLFLLSFLGLKREILKWLYFNTYNPATQTLVISSLTIFFSSFIKDTSL